MTDRSPDFTPDDALPAWAIALLRQPVAGDAAAKARVMALVRRTPLHRRRLLAPNASLSGVPNGARPAWARRGVLAPAGLVSAVALLLGVAGARLAEFSTALAAGMRGDTLARTMAATVAVLGDTIVGRAPAGTPLGGALGGALGSALGVSLGDTIRDTLRLVRFALAPRSAAATTPITHVALTGDFNGWSRSATPLARDARTGAWSVTVAVPRDIVRYAFVVDGGRRVHGGALRAVR